MVAGGMLGKSAGEEVVRSMFEEVWLGHVGP